MGSEGFSEGFVGDSRRALVDGLADVFEEVRETCRPRWVSLEAPSGWGKTRVGQELYARLAAGQEEPRYWPEVIESSVRKAVEPQEHEKPEYALPEYLWWGISCSARREQASPSLLLEGDVRRLSRHGIYCDEAIRNLSGEPGRWKQVPWRRLADALTDTLKDETIGVAANKAVEELVGAAMPGVGALLRFGRWGKEKLKDRHELEKAIASRTRLSDSDDSAGDIVDETVNRLSGVTEKGFPVVMLVEDVHDADEVLLELLDKLLRRKGSLLVVTTGWPERIEGDDADGRLVKLMRDHTDRLHRVQHDGPAGEGFSENAGLQELEEDARREMLRRSGLPDVEAATEQALLDRYVNPYALELFCELYCMPEVLKKYRNSDGELEIPARQINKLPSTIRDLYQELWRQLPSEVRLSLAVARLITPMSINGDAGGGEDLWTAPVLHDVLANLAYDAVEFPSAERVRTALERAPSVHSWVRTIDDYLRAFVEVPQKDIASKDGLDLLEDSLERDEDSLDDACRQIWTQLADTLLASGELATTSNIARCTLALHAEGFITDNTVAARAIEALLTDLADKPRELPERIRLYEYLSYEYLSRLDTTTAFAIRHHGATAHGEAGQTHTAIKLFGELLNDRQQILGNDHPDTLNTRSHLAYWVSDSGRVSEAISLSKELLLYEQRILGNDHPNTLTTRNNLAYELGKSGRVSEAIDASEELLNDQQRILGNDHPDTLRTRNNLARFLGDSGRVDEAVGALADLLNDQQRILGNDHPNTLTMRGHLASRQAESGRLVEAVGALEELLNDQQRILGNDHPDTLWTRNNLARFLGDSGRVDEAVGALADLLNDQQRILGNDHPNTLTTRGNLARFLGESGRARESISTFEELLNDEQRILGNDHPNTFITRNNLALRLGNSGRVDEAISAFEELLNDQQRILGNDHPNTLTTRHNLAHRQAENGRINEAINLFEELLVDQQRILGNNHPNTLNTRSHLVYWLGNSGRVSEALNLSEELLNDEQRILGNDHPDTLKTRSYLASWLAKSDRISEAINLFEELLVDQQRILGNDHPDTLITRSNLAYLLGERE